MKKALIALLFMVGCVHAATEFAPASRIRTVTNNYHILTGTVAQVNFNEIDGWLTNHSGRINWATNLAKQAYDLANAGSATNINELQEAFNHRTYIYTTSNFVTAIGGSVGTPTFIVSTQSIGSIHAGMYVSNAAHFAANSHVTAVDWTNRVITIDKVLIGTISSPITAVAAATGSSSSVTFTHTVPSGYSRCRVSVTGGGGSGARTSGTGLTRAGGAGGTAIGLFKFAAASSYAVTVGRAGAVPSSYPNNGTNGSLSSFSTLLTAYGGTKGETTAPYLGGAGGIAVGGAINLQGERGVGITSVNDASRGGASYWGFDSFDATTATIPTWGVGGNGIYESGGTSSSPGDGVVVIEYY
jgi:hypothetical protein